MQIPIHLDPGATLIVRTYGAEFRYASITLGETTLYPAGYNGECAATLRQWATALSEAADVCDPPQVQPLPCPDCGTAHTAEHSCEPLQGLSPTPVLDLDAMPTADARCQDCGETHSTAHSCEPIQGYEAQQGTSIGEAVCRVADAIDRTRVQQGGFPVDVDGID